ncbi:hypothetical protein D3C76_1430970 [compost metagenome]
MDAASLTDSVAHLGEDVTAGLEPQIQLEECAAWINGGDDCLAGAGQLFSQRGRADNRRDMWVICCL